MERRNIFSWIEVERTSDMLGSLSLHTQARAFITYLRTEGEKIGGKGYLAASCASTPRWKRIPTLPRGQRLEYLYRSTAIPLERRIELEFVRLCL